MSLVNLFEANITMLKVILNTQLIFLLLGFSGILQAGTIYEGKFILSNNGIDSSYHLKYDLDLSDPIEIKGFVNMTIHPTFRHRDCGGDTKVNGYIKASRIELSSEKMASMFCGPFIDFKGRVEGDNFIGTIPWNGKAREIALEKKN